MTPLHHSTTRRFLLLAALLLISGSLVAARHPTPRPRILTREFLDRMLGDVDGMSRSARVVPRLVDGKPRGVKLYAIRPGSYFAELGLENGDALIALNGFDLSAPDSALEAYAHLRDTSHLVLDLERRGERVTLEYFVQ
jgi:general secretion pathway protein C